MKCVSETRNRDEIRRNNWKASKNEGTMREKLHRMKLDEKNRFCSKKNTIGACLSRYEALKCYDIHFYLIYKAFIMIYLLNENFFGNLTIIYIIWTI